MAEILICAHIVKNRSKAHIIGDKEMTNDSESQCDWRAPIKFQISGFQVPRNRGVIGALLCGHSNSPPGS